MIYCAGLAVFERVDKAIMWHNKATSKAIVDGGNAGNVPPSDTKKERFLMQPHSISSSDSTQDRTRKECPICGTIFRCKPSHYDKKTYCSRICMAEGYKSRLKGDANPNYRGVMDGQGKHTCPVCGKEFLSYSKTAKYCSRTCLGRREDNLERLSAGAKEAGIAAARVRWSRHKYLPKQRNSTCSVCGKVFSVGDLRRRYCDDCQIFARGGLASQVKKGRKCVACGKYFEPQNGKKTCSVECKRIHQARRQEGEKSHLWQGGKTSETIKIRNSLRYTTWREKVFARDNYNCAMCGGRGGKLAAHHIKLFATHPELRFEVTNGITLCWPCHASIKGKEQEYEAQFIASIEEAAWLVNNLELYT